LREKKKMKSPLLASTDQPLQQQQQQQQQQRSGCLVRAIVWLWNRLTPKSTECAETIVRLKRLMNQLDLASQNSLAQAAGKRREIERVLSPVPSQERRALARTMLQTAKRYETQAFQWSRMREVAENLKIELVSQQQTMSVYNAFSQTNAAMERIAQTVNTSSVETLMESIQTQIDEGKSVSDIFGSVQMHGYDEDELDDELDALISVRETSLPKAPTAMQPAAAAAAAAPPTREEPQKEKEEIDRKVVHKKSMVIG
jgi:hypothetical protein